MEQVIVTAVIFVIGIGIGALGRDFVRTGRRENAFTRRFGEDLDVFLARFRETTGERVGVIDPFPDPSADRWWANAEASPDPDSDPMPDGEREVVFDDGDGYPRDEVRASFGAARLSFEPRGDETLGGWYINTPYAERPDGPRPKPHSHRAEPDPDQSLTRDLSAYVGTAAPPGVAA